MASYLFPEVVAGKTFPETCGMQELVSVKGRERRKMFA